MSLPQAPMQPANDTAAEMLATIRSLRLRSGGLRGLLNLRQRLNASWDRLWEDDQRRAKIFKRARWGGAALAVLLAISLYFLLRPYPEPDYSTADIDELFNFTLMKDEFNKLSIDRRLELLAMLRARIQKMSAGESALLAAFAAGIGGQARDQLAENISRLMVDMWDKSAADYPKIPEGDRPMYLESTFVSMVRAMQTVAGDTPNETDDDLLAQGKRDAKQGQQDMQSGKGPGGRELGRVFDVLNNGVGSHANPEQRARGQVMMRDMMRQMRGQDLQTGKPLR